MSKKIIPILSFVMTISFIVLVILQLYFFKEVLQKSADDFSSRVNNALISSAQKIQDEEINDYWKLFGNFRNEMLKENKDLITRQVVTSITDSGVYQYISYQNYIIEKINNQIPLSKGDSIETTKLYKDEGTFKIQKDSASTEAPEKLTKELENSLDNAEYSVNNFARLNFTQKPINQRVNTLKIKDILLKELKVRGIDAPFNVAVLDTLGKLTEVSEKDFELNSNNSYKTLLFSNKQDKPEYYLAVYFPSKNSSVIKPFLLPILVTLLTSLIIISIYILSLYFINKQKQISDIKTDFINNMSHEFKTPIATINIATDALKNKTVNESPEKVLYYSDLIKKENARMNKQVEMVLRMTKLERNELEFESKNVSIKSLIDNAVNSIRVIVESRNGTIIEDIKDSDVQLVADEFHLTNALVNLLDNANKYSPENPEITIKAYKEGSYYYIEVQDKGMGMKSANINKIFDKFYREETGNVHNVKGHGLGLTYVKKIVEKHNGEVLVNSIENVGSSFIIKIPINNEL